MVNSAGVQTVNVKGVELAYVSAGQGQPVVFVHGSVNDYRSWYAQLDSLAARYHVVAYSRRYHWPNDPPGPDATFTATQHAADLGALLNALDLAPAHLVGSSYGALTAVTLAVAQPGLVRSLVLGEPPFLPWLGKTKEGAEIVDRFMTDVFRPAGAELARGEDEAGIRTFIDGVIGSGAFDRMPEQVRGMMLDNAAVERLETATPPEATFPSLSPEDVAQLPMPVVLVEGERSPRLFGLITDALMQALPAAERVVIPDASHGMHGQNPTAYNQMVLDFLARHSHPPVS